MTSPASATATALATSDSYRWGSAVGHVAANIGAAKAIKTGIIVKSAQHLIRRAEKHLGKHQ